MNEPQTMTPFQKYSEDTPFGQCLPFESIYEPGCYVCNWSGHLLRLPADSFPQGRPAPINILGPGKLFVTKISNNPYLPMTKARVLASNLDVPVNF